MALDIVKIATGNPSLLSQMSIDEVLEVHPLILAHKPDYASQRARKTKALRAKPANAVIDPLFAPYLLLNTPEGAQPVQPDNMICLGPRRHNPDCWQQKSSDLIKKYNITGIDPAGWMICVPKQGSDSDVMVCEVRVNHGPAGGFSIIHPQWGDERVYKGEKVFLHYGVAGDFLVRRPDDTNDVWIVARKIFFNTYELF